MFRFYQSICLSLTLLLAANAPCLSGEESDSAIHWRTDFATAQEEAKQNSKAILLFFTGSDWCVYCKKLEQAAFHDETFIQSIEASFIPVMLDFPTGFELEEKLTQQNEQLRDRYGIQTYPTLLFTDADGRVFGLKLGFNGEKEELLANLEQMDSAGQILSKIAQGGGPDNVEDPQLLADFLGQLSRSVVGQHWQDVLEKAIELSASSNPDLHQKLEQEKDAIAKQVAVDATSKKIQEMFRSGTSAEEQVKILETMLPAAEQNDEMKKLVYLQYSAMLSHSGQHEKSLAWAKKVADAPWAGRRERFLAFDFQVKQYFRLGQLDEGMQLIPHMWDEYPGKPSSPKEVWIAETATQELFFAGKHDKCLDQVELLLRKAEPGSSEQAKAYLFGSRSLAALGTNFPLRAAYLEKLAPSQRSNIDRAFTWAEAAVCYRIGGNEEKSRQLIESIDEDLLANADQTQQAKWKRAQKAALGTPIDAVRYLMTLPGAPKQKLGARIEQLKSGSS
ncbi:thioredoxin fold domain-containing protein [Bremerella sp. JC817]|uniref:thioredoxin family protein n=1 Tax=Bremerella sp. JC817 TaxID=3231756 RepID=UPI003459BF5A